MGGRDIYTTGAGWQWLVICCVLALVVSACGKKADPEVPGRRELPTVENVGADKANGEVALSWSLPDADAAVNRGVAGFYVYRAVISETIAGCPTCPADYEQIGDVSLTGEKTAQKTWRYTDDPPEGFACRYKVRCYTGDGATGPDSNVVEAVVQEDRQ
ncbi:MAG: hypothetical protein ACQERN_14775 [Thermodesulfobacteriota bacterium]